MGCFNAKPRITFKGSNSPTVDSSCCKGIMTLKKCFPSFTEDKSVKKP